MRNKKQRIAAMCAVLAKNPNKLYSLNYFQEMFSAAKSSISEDAAVIKQAFEDVGIGRIETVAGAHGGIRYIPSMPQAARVLLLKELTEKIDKLWKDKEKTETYSQNCEKLQFDTAESYCEKLLKIYEE